MSNVITKNQTDETVSRLPAFNLRDVEQEGRQLLEQARETARSMLSEAAAKAREVEQVANARGERAGYQAGLKRGLEEGRAQALEAESNRLRKDTSTIRQALIEALSEVEGQVHDLLAEARRDLLSLALALAERICRRKLSEDPEQMRALLEEVIEISGQSHGLVLRVNPADAAVVEQFLSDLHVKIASVEAEAQPGGQMPFVCLESDAGITRGGCIAERRNGRIDARIETQVARLTDELLGEGASSTVDHRQPLAEKLVNHVLKPEEILAE